MPSRSTFLIFYVLLFLQLAYGLLTWYLLFRGGGDLRRLGGSEVIYLPAGLIALSAAAAWFIDRSRARQAQRYYMTEAIGFTRYRTTVLLRLSLVQAANLMALTLALSAQRLEALALLAPGLLVFMFFRPTVEQFKARYGNK